MGPPRPTAGERWSTVGGKLVLTGESVRLPSNQSEASAARLLKYLI